MCFSIQTSPNDLMSWELLPFQACDFHIHPTRSIGTFGILFTGTDIKCTSAWWNWHIQTSLYATCHTLAKASSLVDCPQTWMSDSCGFLCWFTKRYNVRCPLQVRLFCLPFESRYIMKVMSLQPTIIVMWLKHCVHGIDVTVCVH